MPGNDNAEVIAALKKAEKMRIDFVANVSHELRTPLTSIKGYTETLIEDIHAGIEINPDFLQIILKNSNRLLALINDLLDLSAIESGADILNMDEISIQDLTDHALKTLQLNAAKKNSQIETLIECQTLYGDAKRVEQVLTNLADNAIKYCPNGSKIKIHWYEAELEGHPRIVLDVSDNGPGISEKYLDRIFERFYRLDKGRSRDMGGTGLGLSIVKHIMQRHNGTVAVSSSANTGTVFTCKFPVIVNVQF
jgi:two-component system phosphate regulon sensor histidine kinase PhoR